MKTPTAPALAANLTDGAPVVLSAEPLFRRRYQHLVGNALSRGNCGLAILLGLLCVSCSDEVLVVVAPESDLGFTIASECSENQPCPTGMSCAQGTCVSDGPGFGQPDTGSANVDGSALCDNIPNAPGCVDVSISSDSGAPGDTPEPDTTVQPDTTITINDTGPTVPPAVDECGLPGTSNDCSSPDNQWLSCRVDETTKGTVCVGLSTNGTIGTLGTSCITHENCDLLYGCHFGMCSLYCNLAFGTVITTGSVCPPTMPTCKNIGHPQFGACAAQ